MRDRIIHIFESELSTYAIQKPRSLFWRLQSQQAQEISESGFAEYQCSWTVCFRMKRYSGEVAQAWRIWFSFELSSRVTVVIDSIVFDELLEYIAFALAVSWDSSTLRKELSACWDQGSLCDVSCPISWNSWLIYQLRNSQRVRSSYIMRWVKIMYSLSASDRLDHLAWIEGQ